MKVFVTLFGIILIYLFCESHCVIFKDDGNWVIIYDRILSQADSKTVMMDSACKCRNLCFVSINCNTVSIVANPTGGIECRMTDQPLHDVLLESSNGGSEMTFARKMSFNYFFGKDGMFYSYLVDMKTFDQIKTHCEGLLGGQMLTLDTMESVQSFRSFINKKLPDLPRSGSAAFIVSLKIKSARNEWGNGILFDSGNSDYTSQMRLTGATIGATYMIHIFADYFELQLYASSQTSWPSCQTKNF